MIPNDGPFVSIAQPDGWSSGSPTATAAAGSSTGASHAWNTHPAWLANRTLVPSGVNEPKYS